MKIKLIEISGFEGAIRGMRNPLNSWDKSDSYRTPNGQFVVGKEDLKLAYKLMKAGSDHRKYMRMINIYADIEAPFYWWKQFDTYKISTVSNSCSTMHKITSRPLKLSDFEYNRYSKTTTKISIHVINELIKAYKELEDKEIWEAIIHLLPSSYIQKRTVMMNYETLRNMYHSRKNHKLNEWHEFCEFIETLQNNKILVDTIK